MEGDYQELAQATEQMMTEQTSSASGVIKRTITKYSRQSAVKIVNYRCPDFDGNGSIDIFDLVQIGNQFSSEKGDSDYNPIYDLNKDGVIDLSDLNLVSYYFGQDLAHYAHIFPSCLAYNR